MYSSVNEYFTTMDFKTTNKSIWETVFQDEKHHQMRKDAGVTYCSYNSNRNDGNDLMVCYKYDSKDVMENHKQVFTKLLEENREKWSKLGDLNSIEFNHWKILCECSNDMRFEKLLNKTDDVFWVAKHTVDDKQKWINSLKEQQDAGMNHDIRWWGLMENIDNPNEVSCVYRLAKDRLLDFVLNFAESLNNFRQFAGVDVNSCDVKFVNVEWETMYAMPISFQKADEESKIKKIIEDIASTEGGRNHMDENCIFIRPTGNPLNMTQWDEMMNSDDVKVIESKLLSVNKLEIQNNMAYACYTSHAKFNYKGNENDDIAVFTGVFKKSDGVWKLTFGQRSSGRKPEDELPSFN